MARKRNTKFGKKVLASAKEGIKIVKGESDPNTYKVHNFSHNSITVDENLKRWCIQQALCVTVMNEDGNRVQPDVIETAQRIHDWVIKETVDK